MMKFQLYEILSIYVLLYSGKVKELEQVIIRFNGSVLKVTDGTALCNINDLTGDIITINVTRRRKSEGALIVKGRNLSGTLSACDATY